MLVIPVVSNHIDKHPAVDIMFAGSLFFLMKSYSIAAGIRQALNIEQLPIAGYAALLDFCSLRVKLNRVVLNFAHQFVSLKGLDIQNLILPYDLLAVEGHELALDDEKVIMIRIMAAFHLAQKLGV